MTELTEQGRQARERVQERHPYADCVHESMTYVWRIIEDCFVLGTSLDNESSAWISAKEQMERGEA